MGILASIGRIGAVLAGAPAIILAVATPARAQTVAWSGWTNVGGGIESSINCDMQTDANDRHEYRVRFRNDATQPVAFQWNLYATSAKPGTAASDSTSGWAQPITLNPTDVTPDDAQFTARLKAPCSAPPTAVVVAIRLATLSGSAALNPMNCPHGNTITGSMSGTCNNQSTLAPQASTVVLPPSGTANNGPSAEQRTESGNFATIMSGDTSTAVGMVVPETGAGIERGAASNDGDRSNQLIGYFQNLNAAIASINVTSLFTAFGNAGSAPHWSDGAKAISDRLLADLLNESNASSARVKSTLTTAAQTFPGAQSSRDLFVASLYLQGVNSASPAYQAPLTYASAYLMATSAANAAQKAGAKAFAVQVMTRLQPVYQFILQHPDAFTTGAITALQHTIHDSCATITAAGVPNSQMPICHSLDTP